MNTLFKKLQQIKFSNEIEQRMERSRVSARARLTPPPGYERECTTYNANGKNQESDFQRL